MQPILSVVDGLCMASVSIRWSRSSMVIVGNQVTNQQCGTVAVVSFKMKILLNLQKYSNLQNLRPHCFGIIESDLFGQNCQKDRVKYTSEEIQEKFKIQGYKLELPSSWNTYGQARIICYVSEDIKYNRKFIRDGNDHIPTITLEIGLGKATKTIVHCTPTKNLHQVLSI